MHIELSKEQRTAEANRILDRFIDIKCRKSSDPEAKTKISDFRGRAVKFLSSRMVYHLDFNSTCAFRKHLEARGFKVEVINVPYVIGLILKPE